MISSKDLSEIFASNDLFDDSPAHAFLNEPNVSKLITDDEDLSLFDESNLPLDFLTSYILSELDDDLFRGDSTTVNNDIFLSDTTAAAAGGATDHTTRAPAANTLVAASHDMQSGCLTTFSCPASPARALLRPGHSSSGGGVTTPMSPRVPDGPLSCPVSPSRLVSRRQHSASQPRRVSRSHQRGLSVPAGRSLLKPSVLRTLRHLRALSSAKSTASGSPSAGCPLVPETRARCHTQQSGHSVDRLTQSHGGGGSRNSSSSQPRLLPKPHTAVSGNTHSVSGNTAHKRPYSATASRLPASTRLLDDFTCVSNATKRARVSLSEYQRVKPHHRAIISRRRSSATVRQPSAIQERIISAIDHHTATTTQQQRELGDAVTRSQPAADVIPAGVSENTLLAFDQYMMSSFTEAVPAEEDTHHTQLVSSAAVTAHGPFSARAVQPATPTALPAVDTVTARSLPDVARRVSACDVIAALAQLDDGCRVLHVAGCRYDLSSESACRALIAQLRAEFRRTQEPRLRSDITLAVTRLTDARARVTSTTASGVVLNDIEVKKNYLNFEYNKNGNDTVNCAAGGNKYHTNTNSRNYSTLHPYRYSRRSQQLNRDAGCISAEKQRENALNAASACDRVLYVSGLSPNVTPTHLTDMFSGFGDIHVSIKERPIEAASKHGKFYAFLTFSDANVAISAQKYGLIAYPYLNIRFGTRRNAPNNNQDNIRFGVKSVFKPTDYFDKDASHTEGDWQHKSRAISSTCTEGAKSADFDTLLRLELDRVQLASDV